MTVRSLRTPDLGVPAHTLRLCTWFVAAGAEITAGQRLAELLAGEALVELTSPWSGKLLKLCVPAETAVVAGAELARIDADDRGRK